MEWRRIDQVAKSSTNDPDGKKKFYFDQTEIAQMLGCDISIARAFLVEQSVPHYLIGRTKKFFLPEVLEAVEKTRWNDPPVTKGRKPGRRP